ncbi:MAG: hypothetical protein ACJ72I_18605 [Pseudonocardiaceae bacterium]
MASYVLIVGESDDLHVSAVVEALRTRDSQATVVGAGLLSISRVSLVDRELLVDGVPVRATRGWLRRVAPAGWRSGLRVDTHDWAVRSAWAATVMSWLEGNQITWLTPIRTLIAAESKQSQMAVARDLGIEVPRSLVSNSVKDVIETLGEDVICKPVGPGVFVDADGIPLHVPTTRVRVGGLDSAVVRAAPFFFQEFVQAAAHFRVPYVDERVWACRLDADGLPVDWRESAIAHESFVASSDLEMEEATARLCRAMGVGYASADWILDIRGRRVFLDLNPAGQWLFLPAVVADAVTEKIADWLGS